MPATSLIPQTFTQANPAERAIAELAMEAFASPVRLFFGGHGEAVCYDTQEADTAGEDVDSLRERFAEALGEVGAWAWARFAREHGGDDGYFTPWLRGQLNSPEQRARLVAELREMSPGGPCEGGCPARGR